MRNRICPLCGLIYQFSHEITVATITYFVYIDSNNHRMSQEKGNPQHIYYNHNDETFLDAVANTGNYKHNKGK